jgi:hypothetical protein
MITWCHMFTINDGARTMSNTILESHFPWCIHFSCHMKYRLDPSWSYHNKKHISDENLKVVLVHHSRQSTLFTDDRHGNVSIARYAIGTSARLLFMDDVSSTWIGEHAACRCVTIVTYECTVDAQFSNDAIATIRSHHSSSSCWHDQLSNKTLNNYSW